MVYLIIFVSLYIGVAVGVVLSGGSLVAGLIWPLIILSAAVDGTGAAPPLRRQAPLDRD